MTIFISVARRGLLLSGVTCQRKQSAAATVGIIRGYITHQFPHLFLLSFPALLHSTRVHMAEPASAVVVASADADDERAFDETVEVWSDADRLRQEKILRAIKREDRWWASHERVTDSMRAKHEACSTESELRAELAEAIDDWTWNPKRALDLQDFKYLFLNRKKFNKQTCQRLEIINSKINRVSEDGRPGYFNKLEKNVGWTRYILPILFSCVSIADKLVRCGLWANAKNSRRCHKADFCPNCLWNDVLKAFASAFGVGSGAFNAAPAWHFITIGWTTNPANAKCQSDGYNPDDYRPHAPNRDYDRYPVVLGLGDDDPDLAFYGYDDARVLGIVMQEAIAELYQRDLSLINGYHSKHEGEYRLNPGGANRVNIHDHSVVNGDETNGQFLAETLLDLVKKKLKEFGRDLTRDYYPDIDVRRITSPEHLKHAICYGEKVAPIGHAVADALARPEARDADGCYNAGYIAKLKVSLARLINDDIPSIFSGTRLDDELPRLFRRRTEGNMKFNDKGTCIGVEPDWHARMRRKAAKRTRESRERKKQRDEERAANALKAGHPLPMKKKTYPRRRKRSRQLPRINSDG